MTSRRGYTRSDYATVTRLLASFRNDDALRENALVSRHFRPGSIVPDTAERVRSVILASIDRIVGSAPPNGRAIAERQRQILLRHDIAGETRDAVRADLGVTERQFYRDRRTASRLLVGHLRSALPEVRESINLVSVVDDPAEVALRGALRLNAAGSTVGAQQRAEMVGRLSGDPRWHIAARCLLSQIHLERDEFDEAARVVDGAEAALHANHGELRKEDEASFRALFEMARSQIARVQGAHDASLGAVREGIDHFFFGHRAASASDPMTQILLRSVMASANILSDSGELGASIAAFGDVQRSMERLSYVPDYLNLEMRYELQRNQLLLDADHTEVEREMVGTLAQAQRLGFPVLAGSIAHDIGWMAARRGQIDRARTFQSAVLGFAETHDSVRARSYAYAAASLIEQRIGSPQRALALAHSGFGRLPRGSAHHAYTAFALARAQLACGLAEDALASAGGIVGVVPTEFGRGATLLLMAESAAALGRHADARDHLEHAVDRLGTYGQTYLMSQARAMRKRLRLKLN